MKRSLLLYSIIFFATALNAQPYRDVFWATYQHKLGNVEQSQDYMSAARDAVAPQKLLSTLLPTLFAQQKFVEIIKEYDQHKAYIQKNPKLELLVAKAYEISGNSDKAHALYIELHKKMLSNQEAAYLASNTLLKVRRDIPGALKVIDEYLDNSPYRPNNFIFHFFKAQIHLSQNNKELALKEVQKAITQHDKFDQGWLLLSLIHEQMGRLKKAINGMTTYLELSQGKDTSTVETHLAQLLIKQGIQRTYQEHHYEQALEAFNAKDYDKALVYLNHSLKKSPDHENAKLLKVQILPLINNHTEAIESLKTWMIEEPENDIWFHTIHLLYRTGSDRNAIIQALEKVHKAKPKKILTTLYIADLYTRTENKEKALSYHKKALKLTYESNLQSKILFQMGVIYYDQKKFDKAQDVLEQALVLDANYPPLLNLLAYYYATHDNHDEAQKLITRALNQDKNNPHFLDTQAVVHYHNGNYQKALELLTKVVKDIPNDATILANLSNAHQKLGNAKQASHYLQQALAHSQTPVERETYTQLITQLKKK